jgi:hypothetical protein
LQHNHYLQRAYQTEALNAITIAQLPEISATERKVSRTMEQIAEYLGMPAIARKITRSPLQPSLFESPELSSSHPPEFHIIPIPADINERRINRSEAAVLIFWALAALAANGKELSSGVEITEVINSYLVDDDNRKFSNNISRALRGATLREQVWLRTVGDDGRSRNLFGLEVGWEQSWQAVFDAPAPRISQPEKPDRDLFLPAYHRTIC